MNAAVFSYSIISGGGEFTQDNQKVISSIACRNDRKIARINRCNSSTAKTIEFACTPLLRRVYKPTTTQFSTAFRIYLILMLRRKEFPAFGCKHVQSAD